MKKKDFLSIKDLSASEILTILKLAQELKWELKINGENQKLLESKSLVMLFEKPSLRTRLSFEVAMTQLGGHAIYFSQSDIGMGKREAVCDIAQVASSMGDFILARTYKHETITLIAQNALNPVINALTDLEHPCQVLSDLLTIYEEKGRLKELKIAFVGDGENNVTHSLALACAMLGIDFSVASPKGYRMKNEIVKTAKQINIGNKSEIIETVDPSEAVEGADVVYTDTWVSMGDEIDKAKRLKIFQNYQVTTELMKQAKPDTIFMHDMPGL